MRFFLPYWFFSTLALPNSGNVATSTTIRGSIVQKPQINHERILENEQIGTFLLAEIDYSNGNARRELSNDRKNDRPETTLNIELPDGNIYTLTNVNPSWMNGKGKSLESGVSKIKIGKGATISKANIDLQGGAPEVVGGLFGRDLEDENHHRNLAVTGTRSVLAVKVIAADGEYSFNAATLSDEVFGSSGDPVNLVSQYKACS